MATLCSECNRRVSQDAQAMRWAAGAGFLIRAEEGPLWLAEGGTEAMWWRR